MDSAQDTEDVDENTPLLESARRPERNTSTSFTNGQYDNPATTKEPTTSPLWWAPFERIYDVFRKLTWKLFFIWMLTSVLNISFGYDSTTFSGLQNIPAFAREFGTPSAPDGSYALSASRASFMSSVAFAGKLLGTVTAPLPIERMGHKSTIFMACMISFVGIAIECTAHTVAQFVTGRIIIYYSVGAIEVATPMYQAEIVPAPMRGTVVGSLQLFNQVGQISSACVNRVFYQSMETRGWVIPVAVQAVFPLFFTLGMYFIPPAPRWLISKSRKEDAIRSLETVRPRADVEGGLCKAEADAIEDALQNKTEKAPWIDLFRGTNLRRSWIVICVLALQQFTGQGFVSQYSPRFYKTVGLGDKGFDYNIASAVAGWTSCLIGMIVSDVVGRRDLLIGGGFAQAVFLFLVAVFGAKNHPTPSEAHGLVASVVLFVFVFTGTWPPVSYALAAELGSASLREKTMGLGIAVNVVSAFIVAFSVPFLLDSIGANIGWLFGGVAIFASVYSFFCVPETRYRSLEEMDELFAAGLSAREFRNAQTSGAGRRVAELENRSSVIIDIDGRHGRETRVEEQNRNRIE